MLFPELCISIPPRSFGFSLCVKSSRYHCLGIDRSFKSINLGVISVSNGFGSNISIICLLLDTVLVSVVVVSSCMVVHSMARSWEFAFILIP